jgi:hypothetical protein
MTTKYCFLYIYKLYRAVGIGNVDTVPRMVGQYDGAYRADLDCQFFGTHCTQE